MAFCLSITVAKDPILEAAALLIIGVSSLHSSTNFFLNFSFIPPDFAYEI
jgi:hypothetical protein